MARGLLLPTEGGYRLLYEVAGEPCAAEISAADAEPIETAVIRRLDELLPKAELIVAPLATQVFAVRLPGNLRGASAAALAYAVEEHLPWSAEELTVQLVHRGDPSLALAVRTSDWLPLLHALRAAGHAAETLVPAAILRLRGLRQGRPAAPPETWLVRDPEGTHAFQLDGESITNWRFWPATGSEEEEPELATLIAAELRMQAGLGTLIVAGLPPDLTQSLQAAGFQIQPIDDVRADDKLLSQAALSAVRARTVPVNLAIATLASATPHATLRAAARQFVLCAMLLMSVAAGALWWRSQEWQALAEANRAQQAEVFRQTFPGVAVPDAIAARLRSEHRRIVGERGGEAIPDLPQSVMPALASALAAHSGPFRSRFEELAINGAALEVECEFRSHDEAVQMCEQLRQLGVRLESPQIHKLDDTRVGARLRGQMAPGAKEIRQP